jgi:hypothetical protein
LLRACAPASELEAERKEIEDFMRRCKAGALHVLSYRFSEGTPWQQRRTMGERLLHWTDWALQQVREGQPLPTKEIKLPLQIVTLSRDIALVFLPGEPFAGVGLTIRERSPFGLTIPVAWSNLTHPGIIPQGKDLEDGDQLSAAYRFHNRAQYTKPAGDMLAFKALELLNEMKEQIVRRG